MGKEASEVGMSESEEEYAVVNMKKPPRPSGESTDLAQPALNRTYTAESWGQ